MNAHAGLYSGGLTVETLFLRSVTIDILWRECEGLWIRLSRIGAKKELDLFRFWGYVGTDRTPKIFPVLRNFYTEHMEVICYNMD